MCQAKHKSVISKDTISVLTIPQYTALKKAVCEYHDDICCLDESLCGGCIFYQATFLFSWRYIRSERSVILINFCLSIISSNALILIGQTQTRNKVSSVGNKDTPTNTDAIHSTLLKSMFSLSVPIHLRLFVLLWLLFYTSSFSPPSVGFWRRPGSLIWLWPAVWETASYANASSAWDGVSSVCLLYI